VQLLLFGAATAYERRLVSEAESNPDRREKMEKCESDRRVTPSSLLN